MRITVTRAFLIGGERQEVGSVIDVADAFGRELVQQGRATQVAQVAAAGPMTIETTPALVPGVESKPKGKKNARKSGTS